MAKYTKSAGGPWAKASELKSGIRAKIVSETTKVESRFKNDDGTSKFQDVCRVRFEGQDEAVNVNLNRATVYGLIDAFGEESKDWCNQPLTVQTEKVVVAGKRVTALYLLAEGFEVGETADGYVEIVRKGEKAKNDDPDAIDRAFDEAVPDDEPTI